MLCFKVSSQDVLQGAKPFDDPFIRQAPGTCFKGLPASLALRWRSCRRMLASLQDPGKLAALSYSVLLEGIYLIPFKSLRRAAGSNIALLQAERPTLKEI